MGFNNLAYRSDNIPAARFRQRAGNMIEYIPDAAETLLYAIYSYHIEQNVRQTAASNQVKNLAYPPKTIYFKAVIQKPFIWITCQPWTFLHHNQ